VGDNKQILKDNIAYKSVAQAKYRIQISCTSKMNVINTQVEPTVVWMSDHCNCAVGGCTKVARRLFVEVVGVQAAAMCGGVAVVKYLWKHMKYNFRMFSV